MAESTPPTTSNEENIFISNLIEITRKKDEELKVFIECNFFPEKSTLSIEAISNNINILKKMNSSQQALVKGRARTFEEINDPSKYFPSLIAIITLILSLYALLRELSGLLSGNVTLLVILLSFLVTAYLALFTIRTLSSTMKRRTTALFFNALLNSIKFE
ncbi:hypothetical protein [Paenibacillus macquariensis]|uniref:Uncharacterized protein n=1 Tax=Paenibacillus macquariensis TaxID=948756 RepID=A0ABY1JW78_9BACL|nr:hypothetical protein [Paenibacillus macquariensis]MEC0094357.1 hypothetical protein [Paenibacillus macquariensis]OAB34392.1 hypothetical protein PMSM_10965 [Paenibacillus macquariensis subsp. macquariensis]SIQ87580.1 hypothetical protein SAMN05421578_104442 [Paenibacillus macquariensis]